MKQKLFFNTSKQIAARLTEVFDFAWPTAAAMWNLRWQVDGFLRANPTASDAGLLDRFVSGSGIRGANLRRSCIQWSWDMQKQQFAKFLLIEFCALYEAWIDGVLVELGQNHTLAKKFQFPTMGNKGIGSALMFLQASISTELEKSVYPSLLTNSKNSLSELNELLICYRYFKECRNSVVHNGGISDQKLADAFLVYSQLTTSSLGVKEIPEHNAIQSKGMDVKLSLRGVVGFGEIVLKLVCTIDAELSKTELAENVFATRWEMVIGRGRDLPSDNKMRTSSVIRLVRKLDLPRPQAPDELLPLLKRKGLIN